jgi:hypothetical protein
MRVQGRSRLEHGPGVTELVHNFGIEGANTYDIRTSAKPSPHNNHASSYLAKNVLR